MEITIRDEFIKLGQALKLAGVVGRRRRGQACDPGRTCKGKRRNGSEAGQEGLCRRCYFVSG